MTGPEPMHAANPVRTDASGIRSVLIGDEVFYPLCWAQQSGTYTACDRIELHPGQHSWDRP